MNQEHLYSFNRFAVPERIDSPERTLLAAVLERAIMDLAGPALPERRAAFAWIDANDTCPFSFDWVCCSIDLDPDKIREGLKEHMDRERSRQYKYVPWGERQGGLHGGWRSNVKAGRTKLSYEYLHGKKQRSLPEKQGLSEPDEESGESED